MAEAAKYLPIDVTNVDRAFGGKAMQILPPYKDIPAKFKDGSSPWCDWQSKWFFEGLKHWPVARAGIDMRKAMSNLQCVQGSYQPKHEHKAAGVAYLASLWFSSPNGEPTKAAA